MRKRVYENPDILSVTKENFREIIYRLDRFSERELNLLRASIDYLLNKTPRLLVVNKNELEMLNIVFPEVIVDGIPYCFVCDKGFLGLEQINVSTSKEVSNASKATAFISKVSLMATSLLETAAPILQSNL